MAFPKKKSIELDPRGRLTLPKELRDGVGSFVIERTEDGIIHLIPQKTVSYQDALILASLNESITQYKKGKTKKVPKEWLK